MVDYLEKILFPYIKKKRQELKLDSNYPALVIFDQFWGQSTNNIFALLEDNHMLVAVVPVHHVDLLHVEVSQVVSHQECLLLVDQVLVVEVAF